MTPLSQERDQSNDELFEAFIAGFDVSGEGFNGEYVGDKYRGKDNPLFLQRMREDFEEWKADRVSIRGRK